jgi:TolB-like protein/DNA-binding winged helix-turn-helix (wHTH) protein/Tfp pilus assembly protein PilF
MFGYNSRHSRSVVLGKFMPDTSAPPILAQFRNFELDLHTGELRRNGVLIKLQHQPTKILRLLVSRPGKVVTRQELAEVIWGSQTFVDFEQGLNFAIRQVRSVLEDDAEHPRFLETIPKRGYRFIAEVKEIAPAPQSIAKVVTIPVTARHRKIQPRYLFISAIIIVAIALMLALDLNHLPDHASAEQNRQPISSLAVLPLRNLSLDPEQQYFSDGLTDELITEISKIGKLRVLSHTSVNRYKDTKLSLPEIAHELGVDGVVEGTIMRSGNRVRITAQLIDARTDQHLWAESYERDFKDVLDLQADVARQISAQVGVSLTPGEQMSLANTRAVDPEAHENLLKGDFYWNRLNCIDFKKALQYYQLAIVKDPNYAQAYSAEAQAYFNLADWACASQSEMFPKAEAAALKAVQLDPNSPNAHEALGELAFYYEWNWPKAEREYQRAIQLDPNSARDSYAIFLMAMGKTEQGLTEMKKSHQLDPTSEMENVTSTYVFYLAHRYDEAIAQAKKTLQLYPNSHSIYYWLGQCYERKGMNDKAVESYWKSDSGSGGLWVETSRNAYKEDGMRGFWQHQLKMNIDKKPLEACWNSLIYAHIGDKQRTLALLDSGYQHHCDGLQFLKTEPVYDDLRTEPKYKELVARLQL